MPGGCDIIFCMQTHMKAAVVTHYGGPDVFEVVQIPVPIPKATEVLIRVQASSVQAGDARIRRADPAIIRLVYGWQRPRYTLGVAAVGEVVAVGNQVRNYAVGQQVFGMTGFSMGGYAEYLLVKDKASMAALPSGVSVTAAAAIPFGGMTAQFFLDKAQVRSGQRVLVIGAGAVGSAAMQLAVARGATVTGVAHTAVVTFLQERGVTKVLDYKKESLSQLTDSYDVIIDTVNRSWTTAAESLLAAGGRYVLINAGFGAIAQSWFRPQRLTGVAIDTRELIETVSQLVTAGALVPLVDSVYPLSAIAAAHEKYEAGGCRGVVVISPMTV
jgi:NADPH:quinone reductase-like Zn-dependent oxidoreductase